MKRILKAILVISLSLLIGFAVGYGFGKLFGGDGMEQAQPDVGKAWKDIALIITSSLLGVFLGAYLQLIIHEAGHLVCGLISGYRFVSFRILSYTLLRDHGKFKVKRFSLDGTAGQCLLSPPDKPAEQVPTTLYLLGGLLFNLLLSAVCIAIARCVAGNTYLSMAFYITAAIGVLILLTNGIPMTANGFPNDGHSVLHMNGNLKAKSALLNMLRSNALVQDGIRPADLPQEYFAQVNDSDLSNTLETNLAVMYINVLVQKGQLSEAERLSRKIIAQSKVVLFRTEAKAELACLLLGDGKAEEAASLFGDNELKAIEKSAKTQSSKQRYLFMRALRADNNRQKAVEIFEHLQSRKHQYLMQGEVEMDLELMWKALKE